MTYIRLSSERDDMYIDKENSSFYTFSYILALSHGARKESEFMDSKKEVFDFALSKQ